MSAPYIKPSERIAGTDLQDILDIVWDDITENTKAQVVQSLKENEIRMEE